MKQGQMPTGRGKRSRNKGVLMAVVTLRLMLTDGIARAKGRIRSRNKARGRGSDSVLMASTGPEQTRQLASESV